jgi:membrane protein implicated in regulation of membrane protease activity
MIWNIITTFLSMWASQVAALTWLTVAFVAAILEVSIPHFGSAFVGLAAVSAALAAYLGFGIPEQLGTFVVVLIASLVGLRSRLVGRLAGRGVPSRTDSLIGRTGVVTHDIDPATGSGRVNVGGEDWAARSAEPIPSGIKIRVAGADGIVLEVTRA